MKIYHANGTVWRVKSCASLSCRVKQMMNLKQSLLNFIT